VASIGTTGTTAIDPLAAMAPLAKKHGLWLHVDAALAGSAMVLPECRPLWDGVESADSLVFNPHKWMAVGFDFCAFYVSDPQHLIRVLEHQPELPAHARRTVPSRTTAMADPARAALPRAQVLVPAAGRRASRGSGADPARPSRTRSG
jgi:glutamate/tyrosine decarboxylase-like PLP-dependent enzyme